MMWSCKVPSWWFKCKPASALLCLGTALDCAIREHHCQWLHHLLMGLVLSSMPALALDGLQEYPQIKHSPAAKLGEQRPRKYPQIYKAVKYTPLPCSALLFTPWGTGNRAHQSPIQSCLCTFSIKQKKTTTYNNAQTIKLFHWVIQNFKSLKIRTFLRVL